MKSEAYETTYDTTNETTYETVWVRLRGDEEPSVERLWAIRVDVGDDGGTFRLANNGFFSPLVIGDLVEVRRNRDEQLQIVEMRERGGRPGWLIHLHEDEPDNDAQDAVLNDPADQPPADELLGSWRATGTVVEQRGASLSVALDPTRLPECRPTEAELIELETAGVVIGYLRLSDGFALPADQAAWMDFGRPCEWDSSALARFARLPEQRAG